MIHGHRIHAKADADVDAAIAYISQDSLEAALRFLNAFDATCRQICERPLMYARYPIALAGFDELRKCAMIDFPDYLIFYELDADMVAICRVLHGARDLPRVLSE